jgi:hypothetical protein
MEVTNIFHLHLPPNEADALWEQWGGCPTQFSSAEPTKEVFDLTCGWLQERIDVVRRSNMMNAGVS